MKKPKTFVATFTQPITKMYGIPYFSAAYTWIMELYGKRVLFGEINVDEYYSFDLDMYVLSIKFNEYGAQFELDSLVKYLEENIGHKLHPLKVNKEEHFNSLDKSFVPVVKYKHELNSSSEGDDFLLELDKYIKESTGNANQNTLFWSNTP